MEEAATTEVLVQMHHMEWLKDALAGAGIRQPKAGVISDNAPPSEVVLELDAHGEDLGSLFRATIERIKAGAMKLDRQSCSCSYLPQVRPRGRPRRCIAMWMAILLKLGHATVRCGAMTTVLAWLAASMSSNAAALASQQVLHVRVGGPGRRPGHRTVCFGCPR